jgi:hypothetical protein
MTGRRGEAAIDHWTFAHAAGGGLLAFVLPFGAAVILLLLVAYEVFEAALRRVPGSNGRGLFEYESWPNIFADVVIAFAAWGMVAWGLHGWPLDWS